MNPEARKSFPGRAFALRDLVLVVRKDKVVAAAVDIDLWPKLFEVHGRALDMPARPAGRPGRRPRGLARFRSFPKGEVQRVLFALVRCDARPHPHVVDLTAGELTVSFKGSYPEINVASSLVRGTTIDQRADKLDDGRHRIGGAGVNRRRQDVE